MNKIILYTTHCPKCFVLETKLKQKGIDYTEITDIETIRNLGFVSVPVLVVNDKVYNFQEANEYINNL